MRKNLLVSLGIVSVALILIVASCKKINLATDLGQGLIPEVDNIHTFDTTLEVQTFQHLFTAMNDSFKSTGAHEQFLGLIENDPVFGKTDARMFFGIGLPNSKFAFANTPDKVFIDSVVLVLTYTGTYGDTVIPQTIQVSEIAQSANFDTSFYHPVRDNNITTAGVLGSQAVIPHTLNDSVYIGSDTVKSVVNLRIKLDNSFADRLKTYDSTNAFLNDSAFQKHFKGFALRSVSSGNAVMGFSLLGSKTSLAVYYRYENKTTAGDIDTTIAYFIPKIYQDPSSGGIYQTTPSANYIGRDYSGTQIESIASDQVADQLLYIQNTPGTYANLKVPALANMNNSIVHLAELHMESVYDQSDTIFKPPYRLFLDIYDNAAKKYAFVPYAFEILNGQSNLGLFGTLPDYGKDVSGHSIRIWKFDLTRYVQNIVNDRLFYNDLRLYSAPSATLNYFDSYTNAYIEKPVGVVLNDSPVRGRVRLGGGTHPTQKMKMRIVYSKL